MILVIGIAVIGFLLWLILRLTLKWKLEKNIAKLKAEMKKLGLKPETEQTTLANFMHDRFPYERKWVVPESAK